MRYRLNALFILVFAPVLLANAIASAQPKIEERKLTITAGGQRTISAQDIKTFAPANEEIAEVVYSAQLGTLIVRGKIPGETSLLLFYNSGRQVNYTILVVEPSKAGDDTIPVPVRTNVRLDLYFVELNNSDNLRAGVDWPDKLFWNQQTNSPNIFNFILNVDPIDIISTATSINTALPSLDILHATGWGKILRHATVMTTNGTDAEFESGGEFNIQVPGSQGGQDLRTVPFGIKMTVTPQYDASSNRVEVVVSSEVSDLFDSGGDIPGRNLTRSRSTANLRIGEAFVIGGVQARSESAGKTGLPGLSQIPILGVLFGSHSAESKAQENILVIVPTIVNETGSGPQDVMSAILKAYHDYDGNIAEARMDRVINETSFSIDDDGEKRKPQPKKRSGD